MKQEKILGLIAGSGKFPFVFAKKARDKGYKVVAAAVIGDASFFLKFFVSEIEWFNVGDMKKMFLYLKNKNVSKAIMAGQVSQSNLFDKRVNFDEEFSGIFEAIKDRKADTIFAAAADKLKNYGIDLIDSTFLIDEYLAPKGTLTKRGPSISELHDIEFGVGIAKEMGDIDIGQTVVIKDKAIVAIEAMEGTDQSILRGGKIAREGAVIVKVSKPKQDLRFDVPVVGPRTIKNMIKTKSKCLAIEAGKTILINQETCIKLANKADICIVSV
ncbi:MAG: UDP-2,3-diacylglucosamine diphosphatase LpxI [Candidatus Zapsychrus exili]|nr:UDP-2,3-diacylglucosamine diphosphatase LpxI [Candidatus Zapsychrus exili]